MLIFRTNRLFLISITLLLLMNAGEFSVIGFTIGTAPSARRGCGFASTYDGKLYLFGSDSSATLYSFDPASNQWAAIPPAGSSPSPRSLVGFTSTPDGRLYVFGGGGNAGMLSDFYMFDRSTSVWQKINANGSSPSARNDLHMLTSTSDGMVWVFGGDFWNGGDNALGGLFQFNPANNTWTSHQNSFGAGSPSNRMFHGFAGSGLMLYVFGGNNGASERWDPVHGAGVGAILGDFYSFNTTSKNWTALSSSTFGTPPSARMLMGFTSASDGRLYLFGEVNAGGTFYNDLYRYDPSTRTWTAISATGTPPSPRDNFNMATTPDGLLYVFGGWNFVTDFGDFFRFYPASNKWEDSSLWIILCAQGKKYQGSNVSGSCSDCGPGTFTSSTGNTVCTFCSVGMFAGTNGSTTCDSCRQGTYSSALGRTACTKCERGKYSSINGSTVCFLCGPGKYQNGTGQVNCTFCETGKYQTGYGSPESCKVCWPGSYASSEGAASLGGCLPTQPGSGPCEKVSLTWPNVARMVRNNMAWTGGLGRMMTDALKAWVCVNQTCTSTAAAGSPDMPCYVFNEKTRLFVYWANNSFLRKIRPASASRPT